MPISSNVIIGNDVIIHHPELVNIYGCTIGDFTRIGTFVEIQKRVTIGRSCKIQSHTFICEGVHVGNCVFIGHGVIFINDKYPAACNSDGTLKSENEWSCEDTHIMDGVSIGSGAVIMCGIKIGYNASIGAGAVVTKDVPDGAVVAGVPAKIMAHKSLDRVREATE